MSAKSDSMHRPCIVKGWVVNKTQKPTITEKRYWGCRLAKYNCTTVNYCGTAKLREEVLPQKNKRIKGTIINICWILSATLSCDSIFASSKEAKKKTACFRQLQKLQSKKLNRKVKRQGVVFYTKSIKWYCPFEMFL